MKCNSRGACRTLFLNHECVCFSLILIDEKKTYVPISFSLQQVFYYSKVWMIFLIDFCYFWKVCYHTRKCTITTLNGTVKISFLKKVIIFSVLRKGPHFLTSSLGYFLSYVETMVSWTLTLTKKVVDLWKLHNLGFLSGSKSKVSEKEKVQIWSRYKFLWD